MKKNSFGLTFIELLVVTVILSIVSLAIYATFNNGIKIWQRVNKNIAEEDLNIFFDKFARDLRNAVQFSGINFSGRSESFEFATIINSRRLQKITVGEVIYSYEPSKQILKREERDFSGVFSGEEGTIRQALTEVTSLKFKYYNYDKNKKEYLWEDEWLTGALPLAVRIELEFKDGVQTSKFTKTVSIPVSG
jgi:prepilin-type N-terminal cleavage/methylation domain-containing protein